MTPPISVAFAGHVIAGLNALTLDPVGYGPVMIALWVRRCTRCRTVDTTHLWDDSADAHAAMPLDERLGLLRRRKRGWTCPSCGYHEFAVEGAEQQRRASGGG